MLNVRSACVALGLAFFVPAAVQADARTLLVGRSGELDAPLLQRLGATERRCGDRLCVFDFATEARARSAARALRALPSVRYVERDIELEPRRTRRPVLGALVAPDVDGTNGCPALWDLERIHAEAAWDVASGEDAPVIAIADSGFYAAHADLEGRIAGEHDYGDNDGEAEVQPDTGVPGHGTFIAGLLVARPDNDEGRAGVAPNAKLYLMKIVDEDGFFYLSYAVDALLDVAENHPEVGILSYSLRAGPSTSLEDAFIAVHEAGKVIVTAAGNCNDASDCPDRNNDVYAVVPGVYPGTIDVAGLLEDDTLSPFSHFGARSVDVAAPGDTLCSLGIDTTTASDTESGTSYAVPFVAGAAALLMEARPDVWPEEIGPLVQATAEPIEALEGLVAGNGVLDVEALLASPIPRATAPFALEVAREASFYSDVTNVGATGTVTLVVFHGADLAIEGDDVDAFDEGDVLPNGVTAEAPGTLVRASLPAGETTRVSMTARALRLGTSHMFLRALAEGHEGRFAWSPTVGEEDPGGAPAFTFDVMVTEVEAPLVDASVPDASEGDAGEPDSGAVDASVVVEDGSAPADDGSIVEMDDEGGCAVGGRRSTPLAFALLLLASLLRRRRNV